MRNRKPINLIARNGKAMFGELEDLRLYGISHAAKAAIIAEYGDVVWQDTKAYAKAHPAIVPFINQDPHLAASISPNSNKERWLVGDGVAYVDTGVIPDNTTYMYTKFKVLELGNDYIACISYADYSSGNRAFGIGSWDGKYLTNHGNYTFFNKTATKGEIIEYTNDAGKSELKWEDGSESKTSSMVFTSPSSLIIGGLSRNGSKKASSSKGVGFNCYNLKHQGIEINFIPCTYNGQCGMLDLVTLTFHPNANTEGQFTIAVTDKE